MNDLINLARQKGFKKGCWAHVLGEPDFRKVTHNKMTVTGNNILADGTSPFWIMKHGIFVAEVVKNKANN